MPNSLPKYRCAIPRNTLAVGLLIASFGVVGLFDCPAADPADTVHRSVITAKAPTTNPPPRSVPAEERGGENQPRSAATDSLEKAKFSEIVGEPQQDRRALRFFELVVLPLAVCMLLAMVLRRGFLD